ncbi:MAG: Na(+)/H(+) antiporter subunit B [bacterium]
MGEKIILILTVVFAFFAVQTPKLNRAVIYLGVFSFFCSIVYLFYKSPNIAIAEAVIGSTLTTVIYLVALRKQKRFAVYVFKEISHQLIDKIETFCEKEDLIFHYVRFKHNELEMIIKQVEFDLIIDGNKDDIHFITASNNYKIQKLATTLAKDEQFEFNISLHEMRDTNEMENL